MSDKKVLIPLEEYDRLRECEKDYEALKKKIAEEETLRGHYVRKELRLFSIPRSAYEDAELAKSLAFEIMSDDEVLSEAKKEQERLKMVLANLLECYKQRGNAIEELQNRTLWQRIVNKRLAIPAFLRP